MTTTRRLRKIVSGGQTGVDRGALEAAVELGLDHGGWCPRGRSAEDGTVPARYRLTETDSADYADRTERNVFDSDATLVICPGRPAGGTAATVSFARRHGRPLLVIDPEQLPGSAALRAWLLEHGVEVLNVAGPRESAWPGAQERTRALLTALLTEPAG